MTTSTTTRADLAARVLAVIETHRGESAAITAARISEAVGTGNVDAHGTAVRAALAGELEFAKGVVLACARGYFVLADGAEADRYDATLLSRARKILRRLAVTRRKLRAAGWTRAGRRWIAPRRAGQIELFGPVPTVERRRNHA